MSQKFAWEKLYNLVLSSMPDGITVSDIMHKLKLSKSSVYSHIHLINKDKTHLSLVKNIGWSYYIVERDNTDKTTRPYKSKEIIKKQYPSPSAINHLIPKHLINYISELSDTDKMDFIDLIKKSVFYGKSAIALLEANKQAHDLTKEF